MSVYINDWAQADAAIAAVAAELRRWGAHGSFGVSVRGTSCKVEVTG